MGLLTDVIRKCLMDPAVFCSQVLRVYLRPYQLAPIEAILDRIAFLRHGLDWTEMQAASYRFLREKGHAPPTPELRERAAVALTKKWQLARRIFIEAPYAVNVGYVYWGGEGRFDPFGFVYPE